MDRHKGDVLHLEFVIILAECSPVPIYILAVNVMISRQVIKRRFQLLENGSSFVPCLRVLANVTRKNHRIRISVINHFDGLPQVLRGMWSVTVSEVRVADLHD